MTALLAPIKPVDKAPASTPAPGSGTGADSALAALIRTRLRVPAKSDEVCRPLPEKKA